MSFTLRQINITLFSVLFVLIVILFQKIPDNENQTKVEKQIAQLKFENQEMRNLWLSYKTKLDSTFSVNDSGYSNVSVSNYKETPSLSESRISNLIDEKVEKIIAEKISILRENLMKSVINNQQLIQNNQNPTIAQNQQLINKEYSSINDDYFKSNLMLADEIIERAIDTGAFTEWDAEELNNATQDLDFDNRVFIMNKLSHAYNSQKIKGKFIDFELVNRSSEN